jgi:tetratricopeptide (TPR) repeat protein
MMLMDRLLHILVISVSLGAWAQSSPPSNSSAPSGSAPAPTQNSDSAPSQAKTSKPRTPDLSPPRSDRVNADALEEGESSSKDDQIDLNPPPGDLAAHPKDATPVDRTANPPGEGANDVGEFRPWDPHKAAKDVEVGDFYFKRKNYVAAESRYREALYYKDNDAMATFRLAVCLDKQDRPDEARQVYESYLRILPYGPESQNAKKAIERIKAGASKTASGK